MARRPTFINLLIIKLPLTAMSSISHRLSGIINFFILLPVFTFIFLTDYLSKGSGSWDIDKFNFEIKILISLALLSITYHIFSGIRHMIADFTSFGHELDSARLTAIISFLLTFIFFVLILFEVW
tara:strand:- start:7 stop:381 length:375 start_codon:yes stop_codon:yes gene_type:complete